jgi:endo-1,4-beta-xylanase
MLTRRETMAATLGLAVGACAPAGIVRPQPGEESLNVLAQRTGRRFGAAVGSGAPGSVAGSFADRRLRALVAEQCGVMVHENELKWGWVRRQPKGFDFTAADRLIEFAEANRIAMRGHTLLWHHPEWFPGWVTKYDFGANPAREAERMVREHVSTVCRRYGTRIHSYDVVNEAVNNETGAMRETSISRAMGSAEATVDLAFRTAREAAPHAQLCYNDYMAWEPWNEKHRAGVLRLLEGFRKRGVPVDALGVQSHIGSENSDGSSGFGARQEGDWRRFIDAVTGMGYDLVITEFDVHDKGLPADIPTRDRMVADYAGAYLDLMLSYPQQGDIVAWGITDRYSWLQDRWERADKLPKRPLPYDADFQPKPLRAAIADALRAAPTQYKRG